MSQDRPILRDALAAFRYATRRPQVEGRVIGPAVAVGDQEHRGQIGACGERLQIAVHHHRALRIAGKHHLGGRALLDERLVLLAQRRGTGVDAAHEAEPLANTAVVIGNRHRGVVDRLGGQGAAVLLQLRRQLGQGLIDDAAHSAVRGQICANALARAGGPDPVHVRAAGNRIRGTGRKTDKRGAGHSGGARQRSDATEHKTPTHFSARPGHSRDKSPQSPHLLQLWRRDRRNGGVYSHFCARLFVWAKWSQTKTAPTRR